MKTYPYDPRGKLPENHFIEERIIESDNANDRVVILDHAPFFETLIVQQAGSATPLTRGTDYELEYELTALEDSVVAPVFCGVHLINPLIKGPVIFDGQMLGGTFYDAFVEILDELIKYLNNPTSADYLLLSNRPSLFPATPAATSWADMLNKKYLASAVHDVEVDAGAANDAIREKLTELKNQVLGLGTEIHDFNYPGHIAAKNPHNTTAAQDDAHPVNVKTPDTFMAYGKKLRQLTTEVRALGLQQSDIDKYISKWVSKEAKGVFNATISGTRALFRSPNGESEITFSTDAFTLKTNGSIILAAGYVEGDTTTRFIEWKAGINTLRIESSGSVLGMDKLTLNGTTLLTTTALMEYQEDPGAGGGGDPDDTQLYIQGRNGIAFTGKGSRADPVSGTVTPALATTTAVGVVKLKKGPGTETSGVASTPDSLSRYEADMGGYVLKATLLNNVPMNDGSRTMTKSNLGLGSADNTADVDKPLSDKLSEGLNGISNSDHHHDWSELNIYEASQQVQGIGRYSKNQAGLAANRGVTPSVLKELSDRLEVVAAAIANAKPGTVTDFTAVRASTWTFNATKRAMSVTDLRYFYLNEGDRKEGIISGSIDLQTTPMFNWFSPDNRMEETWPNAVINTGAGLTFTGISTQPPMPIQGKQIGKTVGQMGDLSVVSVLAKVRLKSVTGTFKLYIAGGGKITVYLNGEQVATGNSPLYVVAEPPPGQDESCLAIKAECNDATKAAALQFDIYDDVYPLYFSNATTKLTLLQEFVITPDVLRHYLYVNMITGSLYSRAEPILTNDLDIERGFIGWIDLPLNGYASGTQVSFGTMFDFGPSQEIDEHKNLVRAHGVQYQDWGFSDNPKTKLLNKVACEPGTALFYKYQTSGSGGLVFRPNRGLMDWYSTVPNPVNILMLVSCDYKHPYCWYTPFNPKEDHAPTYEGSFVVDIENTLTATEHPEEPSLVLVTSSHGQPLNRRYVRITLDDFKCYYGIMTKGISETFDTNGNGLNQGVPLTEEKEITTAGIVTLLSESNRLNANCLDQVDTGEDALFSGKLAPRWIVRYRYNVTTRVLRISVLAGKPGMTTIREKQVEIKLPFDLSSYFTGDGIGILINSIVMTERLRVNHALMEPKTPAIEIDDYQYLRSLFESYVDAGVERRMDSTRDLEYQLLPVNPGIYGEPPLFYPTEWVSVPGGQGNAEISHRGQLPLAFHTARAERGSLIADAASKPAKWNGAWTGSSTLYREPILLCYRPEKNNPVSIGKLEVSIASNFPGKLIIGSGEVGSTNSVSFAAASSGTAPVTVTLSPADVKAGQCIYLLLNPPSSTTGSPLNLVCTINAKDPANAALFTLTETSAWELRSGTTQVLAEKRHPFHITSTVWRWILSELKRERDADGSKLGEWSS